MEEKHAPLTSKDVSFQISEKVVSSLEKNSPREAVIGQERGMKALRMGTEIRGRGYNVFVTGISGTGRRTAVKKILEEYAGAPREHKDIAYVYNFDQPMQPKVLYFKPGNAVKFKQDVHQLVENLKSAIKLRLESESHLEQRNEIVQVIEQEENRRISEFEVKLSKDGFRMIHIREGEGQAMDIAPLYNGSPVNFERLQEMLAAGDISQEEWNEKREKYFGYMDEMKKVFAELRNARTAMDEELDALQIETVRPAVAVEVNHLREHYEGEKVEEYVDSLEEDLLLNLYLFTMDEQIRDSLGNPGFLRYGVHVLEDRSDIEDFPVVYEHHPSYANLFGNIDVRTEAGGETRTNFMMIQAGSVVRASGGFLIIQAQDLFQEEESWFHLKRALQTGVVEIQHRAGFFGRGGGMMKPEPIEIDTKVIIVGNENLYDVLYAKDPDFRKFFKIHAEFSRYTDRSDETMAAYIDFIRTFCGDEGLKPAAKSGISALIEYGVRLAEDREKLSTRFSLISDLLLEADYLAEKKGRKEIDRDSVAEALEERRFVADRLESQIDEQIGRGKLFVEVKGKAVGRVNGLAVYDRGYHSFGRPAVISARVAPGGKGVVNIEREAGLSGEIHNKGILILESFIRSSYAPDFPVSIHASICFEQSYGEIDGDSASSTEVYALLSALAEVPLRQDIAVTGSVNQMGRIQPVGGITDKVEGFFHVCSSVGLTGTQGVIIPAENISNLIVTGETYEAVEKGDFFIYPVSSVNDGIEILTGMTAGREENGRFPEGSFNYLVRRRLREMADQVRNYIRM